VKDSLSTTLDGVEICALPEGDFAMPDRDSCFLGIERKTINDFLGSLRDGRLVSQLRRMEQSYSLRMLIIEGTYAITGDGHIITGGRRGTTSGWKHASMQMALWSLQQHVTGLVVLWTVNWGGTTDVLRALQTRSVERPCLAETHLLAPVPEEEPAAGRHTSGLPRWTRPDGPPRQPAMQSSRT